MISLAITKLEEGHDRIVNADISKILEKGAELVARAVAKVAYEYSPENIYFVVRHGGCLLAGSNIVELEKVIEDYKNEHGDPMKLTCYSKQVAEVKLKVYEESKKREPAYSQ